MALWLFARLAIAAEPVPPIPLTSGPLLQVAPKPEMWKLADGTEVVLVEDHRVGLVEVSVQIPAGSWSPWMRAHGGVEAWEVQLHDPTGALRGRADALAASVTFDVDHLRSTATIGCLTEDLDACVQLLEDTFASVEFDEAQIARTGKDRKLGWSVAQKDFQFRLEQAGVRQLFAEADPRRFDVEKPAKVQKSSEVLVATRTEMLALPGRIVGFAGDISREKAEAIAASLLPPLGDAPADLRPAFLPIVPRTDRPAEHALELPNLTQVYMAELREGVVWTDSGYPAWLVANHVLAGHFYSRLYVALRHEGGDTYGVGARGSPGIEPEGYALWTFTRTENDAVTRDKLLAEIARFHDSGMTEEERVDAVSALQGGMLLERQAPPQILDRLLYERAQGLDPGALDAAIDAAAVLTLEQVNAFVKDFYDPADFTLVRLVSK